MRGASERVLFCIIGKTRSKGGGKVSTKLKDLTVKSVDLVDQGANQDAHLTLYKRRDDAQNPESKEDSILKRLGNAIAKAFSLEYDQLEATLESVQKAQTFNQEMLERQKEQISDEMWNMLYALRSSLGSILWDEEVVNKEQLMNESVEQFKTAIAECIKNWSVGKSAVAKGDEPKELSEETLETAKEFLEKQLGNEVATGNGAVADNSKKEEEVDMKFEKSKMSPAERAMLEEFEKKYGTPDDDNTEPEEGKQAEPATEPAAAEPEAEPAAEPETTEEVEKGLNPEVAKQLEELRKFKESVEEKELREIAKKYEVIGKKADELVPTLKSLKAAGGTAYNDMIATLDECVEMVGKSGLFSEIGKSGHQDGNDVEAKIEGIAKSYVEKDPKLTYEMAKAKAWEEHPELMAEYDEQAGF